MLKTTAVFLIFFIIIGPASYAHPPEGIEIGYEPISKQLTINVRHEVVDPTSHYINKVVVMLNQKLLFTESLLEQTNKFFQVLTYEIPEAQLHDTVWIELYCSHGGSMIQKFKIYTEDQPIINYKKNRGNTTYRDWQAKARNKQKPAILLPKNQ